MQGLFLSTLSLRRATIPDREPAAGYLISIHALLAESDPTRWAPTCRISNFYPRSPCGERLVALLATGRAGYFYPRSPCGERLKDTTARQQIADISIHALLAESDHFPGSHLVRNSQFLSTLSLRRATQCPPYHRYRFQISIHALLAESDGGQRPAGPDRQDFYPRSPCGERLTSVLPTIPAPAISIHALLAESDSKSAQNSGALLRI